MNILQFVWCFLVPLILAQSNVGVERRIDWVGEPNHRQPQDPKSSNTRTENFIEANPLNSEFNLIEKDDEDDDDLQQQHQQVQFEDFQQKRLTRTFGKGTYLEFARQN